MLQDNILRVLNEKWARTAILLVLLSIFANQISILFWRLYPIANTIVELPDQIIRSENIDARQKGALEQSQIIGKTYLFGRPQTEALPVAEAEKAPETRLNYKLRGIYYSEVARLSSAIIEIKINDSNHYRLSPRRAFNLKPIFRPFS